MKEYKFNSVACMDCRLTASIAYSPGACVRPGEKPVDLDFCEHSTDQQVALWQFNQFNDQSGKCPIRHHQFTGRRGVIIHIAKAHNVDLILYFKI